MYFTDARFEDRYEAADRAAWYARERLYAALDNPDGPIDDEVAYWEQELNEHLRELEAAAAA